MCMYKCSIFKGQSVYIHRIINNMYYNSAGISIIFLHYVLCTILGIMWIICINIHKLGSFLNKLNHVWYLCTCRETIRYFMVISYFVDKSKGYFPNSCVLAKRFSLVSFMVSSPWGLHSLAEGR